MSTEPDAEQDQQPKSTGIALYIHVPFCRQRCAYCHFDIKVLHPRTDAAAYYQNYTLAAKQELIHHARNLDDRPIHSIFFGGGTPSRLPAQQLAQILKTIRDHFTLTSDVEISTEVNPEDGEPEYLDALRNMGVNRLSFGVQTFDDRALKALNRAHTAARAQEVITACADMSLSLDLMLGLPFQTQETLARDLDLMRELDPGHLSVYMLERDLPTPLDKTAAKLDLPDEDTQADFYEQVCDALTDYRHYEISNFAKAGKTCRHNLTYWRCGDYLGIGPAAHGRVGLTYTQNHPTLAAWLKAIESEGTGICGQEVWDTERLQQERAVQGLRLDTGIPRDWFPSAGLARLPQFIEAGLLEHIGENLRLTRRGRLLASEVFEVFL